MSAPQAWARARAHLEGVKLLPLPGKAGVWQAKMLYHYYQRVSLRRYREFYDVLPMVIYLMAGVSSEVAYNKRDDVLSDIRDKAFYNMGHLLFNDAALQAYINEKKDADAQALEAVAMLDKEDFDLTSLGWNLDDWAWPDRDFDAW